MKDKIREALKGYENLKEQVDKNPEKARKQFLEIIDNPLMLQMLNTGDLVEKVENLDLPEEKDKLKILIDNMKEKVDI